MITDSPATRAKLIADTVEIERSRIFGSALTISEQAGLTAALMTLDAVKLRITRMTQGKGGWIG